MSRESIEAEVADLRQRATEAYDGGDMAAAAQLQAAAARRIRTLSSGGPHDAVEDVRRLGSILRTLGQYQTEAGQPWEAVATLTECEACWRGLRGVAPDADASIGDAIILRAFAKAMAGAGASAIVEAQTAVVGYREMLKDLPRTVEQGRDLLDGVRVLTVNADILAAFGDPDLAVGSAYFASELSMMVLYKSPTELVNEIGVRSEDLRYLLQSFDILDEILVAWGQGQDRRNLFAQMGGAHPTPFGESFLIVKSQCGLEPAYSLLRNGPLALNRSSLALTFRNALHTAYDKTGRPFPDPVRDGLYLPDWRLAGAHISLDHVSDPSRGAMIAAELADAATALLPLDPVAATRVFLEAHALFAGARTPADWRTHGTTWARGLLAFARHYAAAGRRELALDFAGWAESVAARLTPFAAADVDVRDLVQDCLRSPIDLLESTGARACEGIARAASRLAAGLWVEPWVPVSSRRRGNGAHPLEQSDSR
jgi:hypothetical protein